MALSNHPVLVVLAVAAIAPLLAQIRGIGRMPVVVLEVLLGIAVGPHGLGLIQFDAFLSTMLAVGTVTVLFMAGMEIDFERIRGRPLYLALGGWSLSIAIAFLMISLLNVIPGAQAPMMVAIALTTTGLGTLLPILRDGGQMDTRYGRMLLAAGTVGEVGTIVAVSLALSHRYSSWQEFGFLMVFLALVALVAAVGIGARPPKLLAILGRTMHSSTQLPVRLALLKLAALVVVAETFGFEAVLGAFAAGMVVGLATRTEDAEIFRVKIDAICFGWFAPFFFVGTGVAFDLDALMKSSAALLLVPTFLLMFLAVRGLPAFLYRRALDTRQRLSVALASSVASLGLIVVLTHIGLRSQTMSSDIAQGLIGAALLSSLIFPNIRPHASSSRRRRK
jgi:Kef-type K+ transport system membrane component KefB